MQLCRNLFESQSDSSLARVKIIVKVCFRVGASNLVFFLELTVPELLQQIEEIVLEEGMRNNGHPFVFGQSRHSEQGLKEQLFPNVIDGSWDRVLGYVAVPVEELCEEGFRLGVRP